MLQTLIFVGGNVFIYMSIGFVISLLLKRNDIADIFWGGGFLVILGSMWVLENIDDGYFSLTQKVITAVIVLWALRLIIHIGMRGLSHKEEDKRYAAWRKEWKMFHLRSFLQVWMLQGVLMIMVAMSFISFFVYDGLLVIPAMVSLMYLGAVVWVFGFFFETLGDIQLLKFKKNPDNKGKILTSGLWSLTRHPNYFGEVAQWWGIFLISVSGITVFMPYSYVFALVGPLTITFLILVVSGIPMLEKHWEGNPEWEEYKKKTPAFFPKINN